MPHFKLIQKPHQTGARVYAIAVYRHLIHAAVESKTLIKDNGKEFAYHRKVDQARGIQTYFARLFYGWQRGSNESFNGLLRQHIPTKRRIQAVTKRI